MLLTSTSCVPEKQVKAIDWQIVGSLPAATGQSNALGLAGAVIGVQGNMLFVGGGANFPDSMPWMGGKKKYYSEVYIYELNNNKLKVRNEVFKLPMNNAYAASCSTSQGLIFSGGENENGIHNRSWLLQWDEKLKMVSFKSLPDLPVAITNASATVHHDLVYMAGGETTNGATDHFFAIDLNNISAGWRALPVLPKPISHSVLLATSNSLYLAGGRRKKPKGISDFYSSLYKFDLKAKTWQEMKSLPYAISAGTGIAVGSNYFMFFGGDKGETFQKVEAIIDAINSEATDSIQQRLIQMKSQLQTSHPGFSKDVISYNTVTDEWTSLGSIPFDVPVTTTAVNWGQYILIPTGEIKAGVRTPQILKGEIK